MASLSSSTNIGASSASSIRGYGGLASGLDRDTLIEGMTTATRSKIAKQQQKKQTYQWQQEAFRSVSSLLVQFSQKYTSYTSPTNLLSPTFWASSNITTSGTNSSYVKATGTSKTAGSVSIVAVNSLAKAASMTSNSAITDSTLSTGDLNFIDADGLVSENVSNLEGKTLTFKCGSTNYTVNLGSGTASDGFTYDYSTAAKAQASFNKALENVGDGNLADKIQVVIPEAGSDPTSKNFSIDLKINSKDTSGDNVIITGGSQEALMALGLVKDSTTAISSLSDEQRTFTKDGFSKDARELIGENGQNLYTNKTIADRLGGKTLTFSYNEVSKSITLDDAAFITDAFTGKTNEQAVGWLKDSLQKKLNAAFGTGRITVSDEGGKQLSFQTIVSGDFVKTTNGAYEKYVEGKTYNSSYYELEGGNVKRYDKYNDSSSVLTLTGGDTDVIGKGGALAIEAGASNRLNLTTTLEKSGLKKLNTSPGGTEYLSGSLKLQDALATLELDGTETYTASSLLEKIKKNDSKLSDSQLGEIESAIKSYFPDKEDKTESSFTIDDLNSKLKIYVDSNELQLKINGADIKGLTYNSSIKEILAAINSSDAGVTASYLSTTDKFSFTAKAGGKGGNIVINNDTANLFSDYTTIGGEDAEIVVKYGNSTEPVTLIRGDNTFDLDGMSVTISGTFDAIASKADQVTFTSNADTDKISKAVSEMITAYNAIIDQVNTLSGTKPDRSYTPLSDEQKEDMSEKEIEKWETKAKEGILFNDSDLRGLSDSLRFIIDSGSKDRSILASYGISISTDYGDKGKLVFDENTFKTALESNPDTIKNVFTRTANISTGEKAGFMAKMKEVTDRYAATTGSIKGILITKAGSTYSATSVLTNSLQKSIDSVDDYIKTLQSKLKTETDRYISQFTNLETLISQMNSQSSYLSSLSGS